MNVAIICVFIASLLPIVFVAIAKVSSGFKLGHNHDPRALLAKAKGRAYYAKCAHDNSWEAFAPFAAAVILAISSEVQPLLINKLAVAFVILRLFYGFAYIFDLPTVRSIIWGGAQACVVALFYQAWSA